MHMHKQGNTRIKLPPTFYPLRHRLQYKNLGAIKPVCIYICQMVWIFQKIIVDVKKFTLQLWHFDQLGHLMPGFNSDCPTSNYVILFSNHRGHCCFIYYLDLIGSM